MERMEGEDPRGKIAELQEEILRAKKKIIELKRFLPREEIPDYKFIDHEGAEVGLSDLFGDHQELILIHNMGKGCVYCTLWADGFNGFIDHLRNRSGFVVVSPDDYVTQKEFAKSRGWRFKMVSGEGTSFIKDMGYQTDEGKYMPGVSTFLKNPDGKIVRVANDYFGPGDNYCGIWHLFDLLPNGADGWKPKYRY